MMVAREARHAVDSMRLSKLLVYFETSPALRLLRSPNAEFIIDFLDPAGLRLRDVTRFTSF